MLLGELRLFLLDLFLKQLRVALGEVLSPGFSGFSTGAVYFGPAELD